MKNKTNLKAIFEGSSVIAETVSSKNYIPNEVYTNLPEPLSGLSNQFSDREKDIILLSSIGVLSACLPNVYGQYDDREYNPNLYVFIIAPPASGKGVMDWSKLLIKPIHDAKYAEYKRKLKEFQDSSGNDLVSQPKLAIKIIPANVSSSKFYMHLKYSEDSALIFESEADSLSNMLKQDWGDFSDLMRKAFQHETCSISRNDRFYEVDKPKLSMVLSGTPNQIKPLISSKESGLFSRFLFYYFDEVEGWKDVSPKVNASNKKQLFEQAGNDVKQLYERLLKLDLIEVKMTSVQWKVFNDEMSAITNTFLGDKDAFVSVTKRLGLIVFRIIMIFTVLRNSSNIEDNSVEIYTNDIDLNSALGLIKYLVNHSLFVFDKYEKEVKRLTLQDRQLYKELPDDFKRSEGVEIGRKLEIPERTFAEILKRWQVERILEKVKHGKYKKLPI
ncbi:DUF3987 domain-containing protein [Kordia jejudonensis]|uniref:DUF3987 domain-containing protein n=1 Tax=Kordia jejudonensis TaxID=1348245 RepID=UPI0006294CD3|nr:DUF3987 domain-containing protein [Kordia jejudonensis]